MPPAAGSHDAFFAAALRGAALAGFSAAGSSFAAAALPLLGAGGFACPRLCYSASIRLTT